MVGLLLLAGCQGPAGGDDAGLEDGAAGLEAPAPPAAPAEVTLTPCPDGWRVRELGTGTIACEPWAEDSAPDCADDALAIPGVGCAPLDACPEDGWPTDLPDVGVIYARAGASDGDGTRERPFGTLAEALARAYARPLIVALAVGEYVGGHILGNSAIRGACAARTIVADPSVADDSASLKILQSSAADFELSGLTLTGGYRALWLGPNARLRARDLILAAPAGALRLDSNARFEGDRIRAESPVDAPGLGFTVWLRPGASVTMRSSTILGGARGAFGSVGSDGDPSPSGISVTLEDSAVLDSPVGVVGAIEQSMLHRVAIERVSAGLAVAPGATAELVDVRGRDLLPTGGAGGTALVVSAGATRVERVYVSRSAGGGLVALGLDASSPSPPSPGRIEGHDVVIDESGTSDAVAAWAGATVRLTRARVDRCSGSAFFARDAGSTMELTDAWVTDIEARDADGDAFAVTTGASLRVERSIVASVGRLAFFAGPSSSLTVIDAEVTDSGGAMAQCSRSADEDCVPGEEATMQLERVRMRDVWRLGVGCSTATVTMSDVDVSGVSGGGEAADGYGVVVVEGGSVTGSRSRFAATVGFAVTAFGEGSRLTLSAVEVVDTRALDCTGDCVDRYWGDGLLCGSGARLELHHFDVSGSARAGLAVGQGCAGAAFDDGVIHDNAIGVLSDESLDPRSFVGVAVRDNATDFNSTRLVVEPPTLAL